MAWHASTAELDLRPTRKRGLLVAVAALAACGPHNTTNQAPTPTNPRTRAATTPSQRPLPPRYGQGSATYAITSVGVVTSPGDTADHADTVTTQSRLTYTAQWSGPKLEVFGRITYRVGTGAGTASRAGPNTTNGSSALSDSVAFDLVVDTATGRAVTPGDSAAVPACPPGGPMAEQARALATQRPRTFAPSSTWSDSTTQLSCLGGVPVTTRTARAFTVAPQTTSDPVSGAEAILVSYQSETHLSGAARRGQQLVELDGGGTGTTQQYYDRTAGTLLSAHTTAALDLDLRVNGRLQRLHQQADWKAVKQHGN